MVDGKNVSEVSPWDRDIGMVLTADQPHRGGHADFAVGEVVAVGIDTRQVRKLAQ